jgi:hypothetical protein
MERNLLKAKIERAKTSKELENVILSIPKQDNGERQQIYRILDDAFWYIDIKTLEEQKEFMLRKLTQY